MITRIAIFTLAALMLSGCGGADRLPSASSDVGEVDTPLYRIGPGDALRIFVWRNPELESQAQVRPDGRITVPLIDDLKAAGKTPTELARDIEASLAAFVQDPLVTIMVTGFVGTFEQQVRVVGAATNPSAIPYRANMTLLDVMIAVGGLTETAAGNRGTLIRMVDGEQKEYRVKLDSLMKQGEISANVHVLPGDIIIIPESLF